MMGAFSTSTSMLGLAEFLFAELYRSAHDNNQKTPTVADVTTINNSIAIV